MSTYLTPSVTTLSTAYHLPSAIKSGGHHSQITGLPTNTPRVATWRDDDTDGDRSLANPFQNAQVEDLSLAARSLDDDGTAKSHQKREGNIGTDFVLPFFGLVGGAFLIAETCICLDERRKRGLRSGSLPSRPVTHSEHDSPPRSSARGRWRWPASRPRPSDRWPSLGNITEPVRLDPHSGQVSGTRGNQFKLVDMQPRAVYGGAGSSGDGRRLTDSATTLVATPSPRPGSLEYAHPQIGWVSPAPPSGP